MPSPEKNPGAATEGNSTPLYLQIFSECFRLRNDLSGFGWGVKLYSPTFPNVGYACIKVLSACIGITGTAIATQLYSTINRLFIKSDIFYRRMLTFAHLLNAIIRLLGDFLRVAPERMRERGHVRKNFCRAPPPFQTLYVRFGQRSRDGQCSLVSFLFAVLLLTVLPRAQPFVKAWGQVLPVPYGVGAADSSTDPYFFTQSHKAHGTYTSALSLPN